MILSIVITHNLCEQLQIVDHQRHQSMEQLPLWALKQLFKSQPLSFVTQDITVVQAQEQLHAWRLDYGVRLWFAPLSVCLQVECTKFLLRLANTRAILILKCSSLTITKYFIISFTESLAQFSFFIITNASINYTPIESYRPVSK